MRHAGQAILRAYFLRPHSHNRHRHLLLLEFFVVSLQHKSGARPMASTLLMLKICTLSAEQKTAPFPSFSELRSKASVLKLREATIKNLRYRMVQGVIVAVQRYVQIEELAMIITLQTLLVSHRLKQAGWLTYHLYDSRLQPHANGLKLQNYGLKLHSAMGKFGKMVHSIVNFQRPSPK